MIKYSMILILSIVVVLTGCTTKTPQLEVLPMSTITAKTSIDMRGKTITTFILYDAVKQLQKMSDGEVLEIVTDNYAAIESDMNAWSRMTGQKLLEVEKNTAYHRYYVEKAPFKKQGKTLAIVISNSGLEELISPLGFALGAALEGLDVSLYFQGPAVRVLKKGFKGQLKGFSKPFSGFARKGMAQTGHIPPQDKIRQLKDLGAHVYLCGPSMDHFGVKQDELIFDDVIIAEYLTFMEIMANADIQFYL